MTGRCGGFFGSGFVPRGCVGVWKGLWGVSQSDVCGEGTGSSCAAHERAQGPCPVCILGSVPAGAEPAVVSVVGLGAVWGPPPRLARAQGRAEPVPRVRRGCGCACPSVCHCGMRDEPKIHPARKVRGQPGVLPVLPRVLPILGVSGQQPLGEIGVSSPVSLPVGHLCWQHSQSGVDGEHPQPRCFSPPRAIPSLFGPGISCCSRRGGALFPFPRCFSPSRRPGPENPRGFCLFSKKKTMGVSV